MNESGRETPSFEAERFEGARVAATFPCPWCKVDCHVVQTDDCLPGVTHPLPTCDAFVKYDALEFITNARRESRRQKIAN